MNLRELIHLAVNGGPGVCQVAVTNACNAHCHFCSFPQVAPADRRMADPARLSQGFAAMKRAGIQYAIFTGGEPLLYPDLMAALAQARGLNLESILVTNGALLAPKLIRQFKEVGLDSFFIGTAEFSGRNENVMLGDTLAGKLDIILSETGFGDYVEETEPIWSMTLTLRDLLKNA